MKLQAIGCLLVLATLAANCSAHSPQNQTQKKESQPSQNPSDPKRLAIEKTARALIADALGVKLDEVKPKSSFIDDLGADELDTVELILKLEEVFEIEIPDEDAEKLKTVQQVYDYLAAHVPVWPKEKTRKP